MMGRPCIYTASARSHAPKRPCAKTDDSAGRGSANRPIAVAALGRVKALVRFGNEPLGRRVGDARNGRYIYADRDRNPRSVEIDARGLDDRANALREEQRLVDV